MVQQYAAARQQHHRLVDLLDQEMIQTHLTELVDEDRRAAHLRCLQQLLSSSVVLPLPRKPVRTLTGVRSLIPNYPFQPPRSPKSSTRVIVLRRANYGSSAAMSRSSSGSMACLRNRSATGHNPATLVTIEVWPVWLLSR